MNKNDIMYMNAALNECAELDSCLFHLGKKGLRNVLRLRAILADIKSDLQKQRDGLL